MHATNSRADPDLLKGMLIKVECLLNVVNNEACFHMISPNFVRVLQRYHTPY